MGRRPGLGSFHGDLKVNRWLTSLVLLCALASSGFAFQSQSGQSPPAPAVPPVATPPTPSGSSVSTVKPGSEHTNADEVVVQNARGSNGNATVKTVAWFETHKTTVRTKTGFSGTIKKIDSDDRVELGSSNVATVSGEGGTIKMQGGSTVTVTNTSEPGGPQTTVELPGGTTVTVSQGSTATFST